MSVARRGLRTRIRLYGSWPRRSQLGPEIRAPYFHLRRVDLYGPARRFFMSPTHLARSVFSSIARTGMIHGLRRFGIPVYNPFGASRTLCASSSLKNPSPRVVAQSSLYEPIPASHAARPCSGRLARSHVVDLVREVEVVRSTPGPFQDDRRPMDGDRSSSTLDGDAGCVFERQKLPTASVFVAQEPADERDHG